MNSSGKADLDAIFSTELYEQYAQVLFSSSRIFHGAPVKADLPASSNGKTCFSQLKVIPNHTVQ